MKIYKLLLAVGALLLILSTFLKIPYISNAFFRVIVLLYILIFNMIQPFFVEKTIFNQCEVIREINGIPVYKVPYNLIKSHNAMIFKGKKRNIIVEETIVDTFEEDALTAIIYHEIGHVYTVQSTTIFLLNVIAVFLNMQGLHSMIYYSSGYVFLMAGIALFIIAEFLKRHIEFKADEYAVSMGCKKEVLISAVNCVEEMNKNSGIVLSGHPNTKRRDKRLI